MTSSVPHAFNSSARHLVLMQSSDFCDLQLCASRSCMARITGSGFPRASVNNTVAPKITGLEGTATHWTTVTKARST
eukprot:s210_g7.t1